MSHMTQISYVKWISALLSLCSVYTLLYFVRYFAYLVFWSFSYHDSKSTRNSTYFQVKDVLDVNLHDMKGTL